MSTKAKRLLCRQFPCIVEIERTGGGHYRLRLENGRSVFTGSTPSDHRALKNLASIINRTMAA